MSSSPTRESTAVQPDFAAVRYQFDRVLAKHFDGFWASFSTPTDLSITLPAIACLMLLMERENEIKSFPASPPQRYTRETFLNDLEDLGLAVDQDLLTAFQELVQAGHVDVDKNGRFLARSSAFDLADSLDSLFPGIPGLSLIAYIVQTIDEVVSGRKPLAEGLDQFDQSLQAKGMPSQKHKPDKAPKTGTAEAPAGKAHLKESLAARKRAYLERLSRMRTRSDGPGSDAAVVTTHYSKNFKIKELFSPAAREVESPDPAPPAPDASEIDKDAVPAAEAEVPAPRESHDPTAVSPSEEDPPIAASRAEPAPEPAKPQQPLFPADERDVAPPEVPEPVAASTEAPPPAGAMPSAEEAAEAALVYSEDVIEEQVKAFEAELAIACPICATGKIRSETTEKGRVYYLCAAENCRFISWGKPFHFSCPLCNNPYLVEFAHPAGGPGLKCPRATCSFRQEGVKSPRESRAGTAAPSLPAPRRRRVVRKVVRKKR